MLAIDTQQEEYSTRKGNFSCPGFEVADLVLIQISGLGIVYFKEEGMYLNYDVLRNRPVLRHADDSEVNGRLYIKQVADLDDVVRELIWGEPKDLQNVLVGKKVFSIKAGSRSISLDQQIMEMALEKPGKPSVP